MKLYIGIDAHSTNYTVCSYNAETGEIGDSLTLEPNINVLMKYINTVTKKVGENTTTVQCGYEAGCLGFTLYKELNKNSIDCVVMAPSTIVTVQQNKKMKKKNDKRDARGIALALGYGLYSSVNIPSDTDLEIRDYIRMRDDHKGELKKIKQKILSYRLRIGYHYTRM